MGMGKNPMPKPPKPSGLDEIDVPTSETNVPHPYFAGIRRLNVSWIMTPIITKTVVQDSGGKKG